MRASREPSREPNRDRDRDRDGDRDRDQDRIAIVVSTAPGQGDLARALSLAGAASEAGADVALFVMDEAVSGLPAVADALAALADAGCSVVACASSASARGLAGSLAAACAGLILGSQDDHAAIVHRAGRVFSFT